MPKISLKSSVPRPPADDLTVEPELDDASAAAIAELKHQIATEKGPPLRKRGPDSQWRFLHAHVGRMITVFLLNGIRQTGVLQEHDQFTIIVTGDDRAERLIYKHAVTSIVSGTPRAPAKARAADA